MAPSPTRPSTAPPGECARSERDPRETSACRIRLLIRHTAIGEYEAPISPVAGSTVAAGGACYGYSAKFTATDRPRDQYAPYLRPNAVRQHALHAQDRKAVGLGAALDSRRLAVHGQDPPLQPRRPHVA